MQFSEWLAGFAKELTIDADSYNRLWQKINAHCISNGVSVDMADLNLNDRGEGTIGVVRYEDLMPLQGVDLKITNDGSGAHCRVVVAGKELSGRVVEIGIDGDDQFDNEEADRGG